MSSFLSSPSSSSASLSKLDNESHSSAASAVGSSLRGRQLAAIKEMLRLEATQQGGAADAGANNGSSPHWKLLLYDRLGQDLLSPILNVKALRDEGVTLHLLIQQSDRDPVPDVPAIYFCRPTQENLERIAKDLQDGLYGSYYFNFISPISRQKLEDLANAAIRANAVSQVHKLYDQYVNFICLESEMFILRHQNSSLLSYHALNTASVTDTGMEEMLTQVVESLFSVCVTLGTIPIIRCPKGNAAEAIASRLDKKLRENLRDARNSLFLNDGMQAGQYSFYRPVLVLLDRQFDLATPLHHTWTYQAMTHDVLQYSLNRVTVTEETPSDHGGPSKKKTKSCDLDAADAFWQRHKGAPFPEVAEKIQKELEDYRSKEDDIKRMKHEMGGVFSGEGEQEALLSGDNTQRLTSAVSSLPALLEKKRLIDMHMSVATSVLDQVKLRKLDLFYELEEKVLAAASNTQSESLYQQVKDVLEDPEAGTPDDRMRLFLIYFLRHQALDDKEVERLSAVLESSGSDISSLRYLQRWKSLSRISSSSGSGSIYGDSASGSASVGADTHHSVNSMFSSLVNKGSSFVMEGVKNLVVKKQNLPVTKIVEEIMEIRPGPHNDDYAYFDPKILRGNMDNMPRAKNPFHEAIVFVVGGGNYIEYQNLMAFANSSSKSSSANLSVAPGSSGKRIIYGCSTMTSPNQMLKHFAELGHEM
jgi:hypothetical protein